MHWCRQEASVRRGVALRIIFTHLHFFGSLFVRGPFLGTGCECPTAGSKRATYAGLLLRPAVLVSAFYFAGQWSA